MKRVSHAVLGLLVGLLGHPDSGSGTEYRGLFVLAGIPDSGLEFWQELPACLDQKIAKQMHCHLCFNGGVRLSVGAIMVHNGLQDGRLLLEASNICIDVPASIEQLSMSSMSVEIE